MRLVSFGQVQCKQGRDCMLELSAGCNRRGLWRHSVHLVCLGQVCSNLWCVDLLKVRRGHLLKCGCVELHGLHCGHLRSGELDTVHGMRR